MIRQLPKDIITKIILDLSSIDRVALLVAYPDLKINWQQIYNQKRNSLTRSLRQIHDKYFPETTKERMNAINNAYKWFDLKHTYDDHTETDEFYDNCDIPIIYHKDRYRLEDYRDSIRDYIYKDIYNLKKEMSEAGTM